MNWTTKVWSTVGVLLHLFFLAFPRDLFRWLTLKRRPVKGRTIVITGGGSGIGRGLAHNFAVELRARVAIIDVNKTAAEETVAEIVEQGGDAWSWICDIADEKQLWEVAKQIESHYGKIDIVICNAAVLHFGLFMELTLEQLKRAMEVNVLGTINTIRAFLGDMEKRNEGQIVTVSSIAGFAGETYGLAYCPTKFAVRGVMECLQMELRDRGLEGIHCTTVCPYFVRTPMINRLGMRPTSTWFPFMSVNSCTRRIVDAILKRKVLYFMPNYINLVANIKPLLSYHAQKALREYVNCRYEPVGKRTAERVEARQREDAEGTPSRQRAVHFATTMADYFRSPHTFWWLLIVPALIINFLAWYRVELLSVLPYLGPFTVELARTKPWILVATNLFALVAHLAEAICALSIADKLKYSFSTKSKWFLQTFIVGYPSLRLIIHKNKTSSPHTKEKKGR